MKQCLRLDKGFFNCGGSPYVKVAWKLLSVDRIIRVFC